MRRSSNSRLTKGADKQTGTGNECWPAPTKHAPRVRYQMSGLCWCHKWQRSCSKACDCEDATGGFLDCASVANGNAVCGFFAVCDDAISCQEYAGVANGNAGVANGNAAIDVYGYDDRTSCLDCDCIAAQGCRLSMDACGLCDGNGSSCSGRDGIVGSKLIRRMR